MAMVLFGQNLGGSIFLVIGNAIFNNSLRKQLQERISIIGIDPDVIIDAGARSVRDLGLSVTELAAVVQSYANAVDRVMYLGVAVGVAGLAVSWGMGNSNIMEIKKLKELTNEAKPAEAEADKQDTEKQAAENLMRGA